MLPLNHVSIMELILWELVGFQKCPLGRCFIKCCTQKHLENSAELVGDFKKTLNILYGFTEKPLDLCCYCTDKFQTDSGKSSLDSAQNKLYLLIFPTLQFANVSVGNLSSNKFRLSTFMSHWSGRSSQRFKCIRRLKPKNLRFTCFKLVILLHN